MSIPYPFTDENLYAATEQAQTLLRAENPGQSIELAEIGHRAWRQLTPVQQAHALHDLFTMYVAAMIDQRRALELDEGGEAKTYIEPDDEYYLALAVAEARPFQPDATIIVDPRSLSNVLDELDLLRHRLEMARGGQAGAAR
ncbi:hypothetical protein [Streptomyces carpaticus]|uniref:hypothetical protein n=1 Tax=Streptomyces carpaticus TaxID=285558 RepID=UPI0031F97581